jgi:hypothetical protein
MITNVVSPVRITFPANDARRCCDCESIGHDVPHMAYAEQGRVLRTMPVDKTDREISELVAEIARGEIKLPRSSVVSLRCRSTRNRSAWPGVAPLPARPLGYFADFVDRALVTGSTLFVVVDGGRIVGCRHEEALYRVNLGTGTARQPDPLASGCGMLPIKTDDIGVVALTSGGPDAQPAFAPG